MPSLYRDSPHATHGLLIVDDVAEIRRLIRLVIPRALPVREAQSGEAAREALSRQAPRVAIVDLGLGGAVTGLDLVRLILSEPALQHTRVVVVTGRDEFAPEAADLLRRAHGFFRKPFSPLAVADHIRGLLDEDGLPPGDSP